MRNAAAVPQGTLPNLEMAAVYMTPTGRLCKLYQFDGRGGEYAMAKFRYVRRGNDQASVWGEGFCLMPENWRILTRVG